MDSHRATRQVQGSGARRGRRSPLGFAAAVLAASAAALLLGCSGEGEGTAGDSPEESASSSTTSSLVTPLSLEVTQDVPFTSERGMDVYAPGEGSDWPMVVHFHGGVATPEGSEEFATSVAEQGVVVMVPQWRSLGPAGGSEDTVCAIAFANERGDEYGGDTDSVTLSGYSTGGFTAVIHGFIGDTPPRPVTDCLVDPAIEAPEAVVGGGAPLFAAEWARAGLLAQNPQWGTLTPEQIDAFDPYMAIGRNPELRIHLVFAEDDVGGNPNLEQPIAESNRAYLKALAEAGYDVEATEVPGGHGDPLVAGSFPYDTYVSALVDTANRSQG